MGLKTSRLLHIADLHLGQEVNLEQFLEFKIKIVDLCSSDPIDIILIAGDLFDNSRLKDEFIAEIIDMLIGFGPRVVILPGNHDCYEGNTPYKRIGSRMSTARCLNVLNANNGEDLIIGSVHIWGKPVIVHDEENRPLKNISKPKKDMWNVAVAHGHLHRSPSPSIYSSIIKPDEISNSGYSYIALGHWHFTCDVSCGGVTAYYSGSPFGPTLNGKGGTGLLVTFASEEEPLVEIVRFD